MDSFVRSPFQLHHEIFILDAYLKKPLNPTGRKRHAQGFIKETLDILRMETLGPLQFHDAVDTRAPGWSFIQAITTSHISAHYFEKPGKHPHIRIDFYSCQSVDWQKVIEMSHKHFVLADWHATFIERKIGEDAGRRILDIQGNGNQVRTKKALLDHATISITEPVLASAAV